MSFRLSGGGRYGSHSINAIAPSVTRLTDRFADIIDDHLDRGAVITFSHHADNGSAPEGLDDQSTIGSGSCVAESIVSPECFLLK